MIRIMMKDVNADKTLNDNNDEDVDNVNGDNSDNSNDECYDNN